MYCAKCGNDCGNESAFCDKCGNFLKSNIENSIQQDESERINLALNQVEMEKRLKGHLKVLYLNAVLALIALFIPNASVNEIDVSAIDDSIGMLMFAVIFCILYLIYIKKFVPIIFAGLFVAACGFIEAIAVLNIVSNPPPFVRVNYVIEGLFMPILTGLVIAYWANKCNKKI